MTTTLNDCLILLALFTFIHIPSTVRSQRGSSRPGAAAASDRSPTTAARRQLAAVTSTLNNDEVLRQKIDELETLGVSADEVLRYVRRRVKEGRGRTTGSGNGGVDAGSANCRQESNAASRSVPVRRMAAAPVEELDSRLMYRYTLRNRTAVCNDGSRAGYYIRKTTSRRWIIFIDGGWFCFDAISCQSRWINTPHLMSSERWPSSRPGSGILSPDATENPFIYNGNAVYVPYCSSDAWSGTYTARVKGEFSFVGSLILDELLTELTAMHGLVSASDVYLAGSSAGGTGVLVNLDRLSRRLSTLAPGARLRGIADSGWFLDNIPYRHQTCTDALMCSPSESVQRGIQLWRGLVPDECRPRYPGALWKCYFGYRIYSSLQTLVFVVQHLFDEAQIMADNVGPPVYKQQWQYIHRLGLDMRNSLTNVSAVFAPACLSHLVLTRSEWHHIHVNGVTLPEALICWENGKHERNGYDVILHRRQKSIDTAWNLMTGVYQPVDGTSEDELLADQSTKPVTNSRRLQNKEPTNKVRHHGRQRGRNRRFRQKQNSSRRPLSVNISDWSPASLRLQHTETVIIDVGHGRRRRRAVVFDEHDVHRLRHDQAGCYHRTVDACVWPQCNVACPNIRNPFTGREMDLTDLLRTQLGTPLHPGAPAPTGQASRGLDGTHEAGKEGSDRERMLRLLMQTGRRWNGCSLTAGHGWLF